MGSGYFWDPPQESQAQPCSGPPLSKCREQFISSTSTEAPTLFSGKLQCLGRSPKSQIHRSLKTHCVETAHGCLVWPRDSQTACDSLTVVSFFGGKALIKYKGAISARLTLRFRTWIVTYRWTFFGLHGVLQYLNFPQDSHNPFHSCVAAWGVLELGVAALMGSSGPQGIGELPESRTPGHHQPWAVCCSLCSRMWGVGRASHPDYKSFITSRSKWGGSIQ